MSVTEFIDSYLKEHELKLTTNQKGMLKSLQEGKMLYYPGIEEGKSVLADALRAYYEYKER